MSDMNPDYPNVLTPQELKRIQSLESNIDRALLVRRRSDRSINSHCSSSSRASIHTKSSGNSEVYERFLEKLRVRCCQHLSQSCEDTSIMGRQQPSLVTAGPILQYMLDKTEARFSRTTDDCLTQSSESSTSILFNELIRNITANKTWDPSTGTNDPSRSPGSWCSDNALTEEPTRTPPLPPTPPSSRKSNSVGAVQGYSMPVNSCSGSASSSSSLFDKSRPRNFVTDDESRPSIERYDASDYDSYRTTPESISEELLMWNNFMVRQML